MIEGRRKLSDGRRIVDDLFFRSVTSKPLSLSLSLDLKIRKIQQDGGEESEQRVQDRTHENALEKNTGEKEKERREELIDLSTMDPRCTWLQKLMIYVSGPGDGERSREEAGMCTRRSRRALWRSQSGLLPLLASSSPRPSARPLVRSSRRLARARGGGRENKNGRERIGGLFYRGRGRSGVLFTLTGKRESILSRKETGNVVRLSRIPGRGTDCFRFLRKKRKGEEWTPDKSAGPLSRTGSLGGGPVIPRLVEESVYREFTSISCVFLEMDWHDLRRGDIYKIVTVRVETTNSNFLSDFFSIKYLYRLSFFADRGSFVSFG